MKNNYVYYVYFVYISLANDPVPPAHRVNYVCTSKDYNVFGKENYIASTE